MSKKPAPKKLTSEEAKSEIIRLIGEGKTIADAVDIVGKSRATYDYYRRTDNEFAKAIDNKKVMVARGKAETPDVAVPDFPEFCEKYLGQKLFPHQLQWYDVLEGREPRELHPSMTYEQGDPDLLIVNTPPGHAKSTTITSNYVTWRIVKDPNVKIVIISKTARLAEQFLLQIKNRLTHPAYSDLQRDFAPPGGFQKDSSSWKQNLIYVSSNVRGGEAKDPTVQALGIGGQLYGARADLIVIDDGVDLSNAHDYEKQIEWVQGEVMSRLPDGGKLFVVGTRLSAKDMYLELRNPNRYGEDETTPFTYFAQPAVLEFADEPKNWKTLWPLTDAPSGKHVHANKDGLYAKWNGESLVKRRARMTPARWSRMFQQQQVAEDNVFIPSDIKACQSSRPTGFSIPERESGTKGLYIVAGLDPAAVGHTAAVVMGVDQRSAIRYVLDVHNKAAMSPDEMRELIKSWTEKYNIKEWRIERNAFQRFLTLDTEINSWLAARGVILTEHLTGNNKNDVEFGVMAMASLFHNRLISLPNSQSEGVKALIEQLVTWQPDAPKANKTDTVMALWFAELRAIEVVSKLNTNRTFGNSQFITRGERRGRQTVDINELFNEQTLTAPTTWWK